MAAAVAEPVSVARVRAEAELIRLRVGLARPQIERALGRTPDMSPDQFWTRPSLPSDLARLESCYKRFVAKIKLDVDREFADPVATSDDGQVCISTAQVARSLQIGEFNLSNLRDRGTLAWLPMGVGRTMYTRAAVYALIDNPFSGRARHSPLASVFLRFWEQECSA